MKKYFALLMLLTVTIFGCKKGEDKDSQENSMEYSINGLSNVTYKFAKLTIPVELKHLSGPQEAVNLSVSGLPAGMKSVLSTTSGTPTFGTFIELTNSAPVAIGTYPLKFTSATTSGKSKSVDFNLLIENSCAENLAGNYSGTSAIFILPNCRISSKTDNQNRIYIYDEATNETLFYGDLDCMKGTLVVPSQQYGSSTSTLSGTGTFTISPKDIVINLEWVFTGSVTHSDILHFTIK